MQTRSNPPHILNVSTFTQLARQHVEAQFRDVTIEGEISNFKKHTSGHCYFTLKDANAQVRCVMWRNAARALYFTPQDGMLVRLYGNASVYEKRGDLQLVARALRHAGEGGLQKAFEELKQKLAAEGLFSEAAKKSLPVLPRRIGIATSATGAAIHDILSIIERRFPLVEVILYPVHVQGVHAVPTICEALNTFNSLVTDAESGVDLIILGRGGGSLEDLWAFNDEQVARAIYASQIPIVCAVGHETDVTISDFVADLRAATPSMAAELVTPDRFEIEGYIQALSRRVMEKTLHQIEGYKKEILAMTNTYRFHRPADQLTQLKLQLDALSTRLDRSGDRYIDSVNERVIRLREQLELLDPERPLRKGYVMVEQDGHLVRSAHNLKSNQAALLRFIDGSRSINVKE